MTHTVGAVRSASAAAIALGSAVPMERPLALQRNAAADRAGHACSATVQK